VGKIVPFREEQDTLEEGAKALLEMCLKGSTGDLFYTVCQILPPEASLATAFAAFEAVRKNLFAAAGIGG